MSDAPKVWPVGPMIMSDSDGNIVELTNGVAMERSEYETLAAQIYNSAFDEAAGDGIIYQTGYIVKENGDITLSDGTVPPPGVAVTISPEHMRMAIDRKRRAMNADTEGLSSNPNFLRGKA